jgi:hypothetical protein
MIQMVTGPVSQGAQIVASYAGEHGVRLSGYDLSDCCPSTRSCSLPPNSFAILQVPCNRQQHVCMLVRVCRQVMTASLPADNLAAPGLRFCSAPAAHCTCCMATAAA